MQSEQATEPPKSRHAGSHPPPKSFREWFVRGLQLLCVTAAILGWFFVLLYNISQWHPLFDLATHFAWHAFVGLTLVGVILILGRFVSKVDSRSRWSRYLVLWSFPWIFVVWITSPWQSIPLATNDSESSGLKILSWNIWLRNRELNDVIDFVKKENADVVILIELASYQMSVLEKLQADYPQFTWVPDGAAGIAVLSRIPETKYETIQLANYEMPAVDVSIPKTEHCQAFRLLAVHTLSPSHQSHRTITRDKQLDAIAEWTTRSKQARLVIGDLNVSPWSKRFPTLLEQGKLSDTRAYRGNLATWPSFLGEMGIPIDHALATEELEIVYRGVDNTQYSSDHRPIRVTVR